MVLIFLLLVFFNDYYLCNPLFSIRNLKKNYKTKLKIKIVRITLQILNINCILSMIISLNKYNHIPFGIPK